MKTVCHPKICFVLIASFLCPMFGLSLNLGAQQIYRGITIEGEDASYISSTNGASYETWWSNASPASAPKLLHLDNVGNFVTYTFNVPASEAGNYVLVIRHSDDVGSFGGARLKTYNISIDGVVTDTFVSEKTGTWNDFIDSFDLNLGYLSEGTHVLKIQMTAQNSTCCGTHFDTLTFYSADESVAGNLTVAGATYTDGGLILSDDTEIQSADDIVSLVEGSDLDLGGSISIDGTLTASIPVTANQVATKGYVDGLLSSGSESDPLYSASVASGITAQDVDAWRDLSGLLGESNTENSLLALDGNLNVDNADPALSGNPILSTTSGAVTIKGGYTNITETKSSGALFRIGSVREGATQRDSGAAYFQWFGELEFNQSPDPAQVAYLYMGKHPFQMWGYFDVTVTGDYWSPHPGQGAVTKRFPIAYNAWNAPAPGSLWGNDHENAVVLEAAGGISRLVSIGDIELIDDKMRVPIYFKAGSRATSGVSVSGIITRAYNEPGYPYLTLEDYNDPIVVDNAVEVSGLKVDNGIVVGDSTEDTAGAIRYNGTDFEGYDGAEWKSMTQGLSNLPVSDTIPMYGE